MRRLLFFTVISGLCALSPAHAYVTVACGRTATDPVVCVLSQGTDPLGNDSGQTSSDAMSKCQQSGILDCRVYAGYGGACHGISATYDGRVSENSPFGSDIANVENARISAFRNCTARYQVNNCRGVIAFCDVPTAAASTPNQTHAAVPATLPPGTLPSTPVGQTSSNSDVERARINAITIALSVLSVLVVILIYTARAPITNYIIHGNLPYSLPVYGEDIQCLFKRKQRVNWYGRVIFGLVANLSMSQDQLADVRKYWLGRVVAFDSLRRQRQNQLAKMHMQLAASVTSEAKDKTSLSQFLAALKFIFFFLFYLLRALFSFLFGFLFIRVTIAKLVRGAVIESKDLTLLLQSKAAIEDSATYLKEYLETANTFDGRDEVV